MLSWTAQFLKSQLLTAVPVPTSDFSHQTVIVTGSNTGLGLEAARRITRLGASKVILAVRTPFKGESAAADIVQSCNVPKSTLEVWKLDMSDYDSIKAFAKRAEGLDRLDAAVLNAGILTNKLEKYNGIESHIAVNVIGSLLLTTLLLPKLRQSARLTGQRGRLTVVGSDTMYIANIVDLEDDGKILDKLNHATIEDMGGRYPLSKMLLFYSLRELARRSPVSDDSNVLITDVTPGLCKSELIRHDLSAVGRTAMSIMSGVLARTTEQGSRTLAHAVSPDLQVEAHGRFLMDCTIYP